MGAFIRANNVHKEQQITSDIGVKKLYWRNDVVVVSIVYNQVLHNQSVKTALLASILVSLFFLNGLVNVGIFDEVYGIFQWFIVVLEVFSYVVLDLMFDS